MSDVLPRGTDEHTAGWFDPTYFASFSRPYYELCTGGALKA